MKKHLPLLVPLVLALPLWWTASHLGNYGVDWSGTFYPAARMLIAGQNPYTNPHFHNPIWTLFPLVPLALLGETASLNAYTFAMIAVLGFMMYRLEARPIAMTAFLISPLVIVALNLGNVDLLSLLGFVLPAPIGLFFIMMKPQLGMSLAIFWAWSAWKAGGLRRLVLTFLPLTLATAASFLIFGNWLASSPENLIGADWNLSIFPWGLPLGAVLLYVALRYNKVGIAFAVSPLLSPYVSIGSWCAVLLGLLYSDLVMVSAVWGLWVIVAYSIFQVAR